MNIRSILFILLSICALRPGAQTLTATYVELADSADRCIKQERWTDAERLTISALRHEPANKSNWLLWSNLGVIRTNLGNLDGALEAFEIGLASAPRSTMLLTNRARAYLAKGDAKAAETDLDTALAADTTLQWARKMRGIVRASRRDYKGAGEDFDFYTRRFGDDTSVLETQGDMLLAQGQANDAAKKYFAAYARDNEEAILIKALAAAWEGGTLDKHEDELRKGIERFTSSGDLYLMRAMLNKSRYQTHAMERDLQTALKLGADPHLYDFMTGRESSKK